MKTGYQPCGTSSVVDVRGFRALGYFIPGRDGTRARWLGKNPCRRRATLARALARALAWALAPALAWALARARLGPSPGPGPGPGAARALARAVSHGTLPQIRPWPGPGPGLGPGLGPGPGPGPGPAQALPAPRERAYSVAPGDRISSQGLSSFWKITSPVCTRHSSVNIA